MSLSEPDHFCALCFVPAEHHIMHVREMKESSNRRLLTRQRDVLMKRARPGERLARHPVTQHGIYVCTQCGKPGHTAGACGAASPSGTPASDREEALDDGLAPIGPVPPCWLCGNLPFTLGLDVSNKVCMGLSRDSVKRRMDYSRCTPCQIDGSE